jgi:hypothetical protein
LFGRRRFNLADVADVITELDSLADRALDSGEAIIQERHATG